MTESPVGPGSRAMKRRDARKVAAARNSSAKPAKAQRATESQKAFFGRLSESIRKKEKRLGL
jgi:hypothetical protein